MKKRYIIPLVLVFVLMSAAIVSGQCYNPYVYCYPTNPQPVVRECVSFVSDVTIPDGTYIAPGSTFVKTWRIRNNGTTTWTTNYKLVFVSGTQMASQNYVNLPYNVGPGQTVDISIQMTAPMESGSYKSSWMLVNESGAKFGVGANCQTAVWAQIVNYVQTYTCTPYCVQPCYPQPPCYWQPPCWGYNCGVRNFDRDGNLNPIAQNPEPRKPPAWYW